MMMQTRSAGVDWMSSEGGSATIARLSADLPPDDCAPTGIPAPAAAKASRDDTAVRRRMRRPGVMEVSCAEAKFQNGKSSRPRNRVVRGETRSQGGDF